VVFIGWRVLRSSLNQEGGGNTKASQPVATTAAKVEKKQDKTAEDLSSKYVDPTSYISVSYPSAWKVDTKREEIDARHPVVNTTITSPNGTVLYLNTNWGGRGGACFAKETDKPFQPDNECASAEYLSTEATKIENVYDNIGHFAANGAYSQTREKSRIVMVTKHFAQRDGQSKYVIGLRDSNADHPVAIRKPVMGNLYPDEAFSVHTATGKMMSEVHAYVYFDDESALDSQDALTIKKILHSLTVNVSE
jgi:hypothetical protein